MSWKGLSKAVSRLPHQVLSKTGRADASTDPEYRTLQRQFDESVRVATLLHKEAETYKSALTGMLQHQCSFSDVLAEIYEPFSGEEANQAEAAQEYSRASKEMQEELLMHINMLDDMVVLPLSSLQDVLKRVSKAMAKRDRKKLDFDRYSHAMQKFKDEQNAKSIAKAQDNLRMATEEYDKYNDLLKNELPQLFELEAELTGSVLLQLYDLQCLIYGSLVERMQSIAETGHYATPDQDVVAGYQQRVAEAKARESIENLQMFEKNLDAKLSRNYKREHEKEEQQDHQEREQPYTQNNVQQAIPNSYEPSAPPLSEAPDVEYQEHPEVYAVALYAYEAQGTNDLGFRKDQTIQILEPSTDNTNTWWMARIDDKEGFVPANYVKLT